MRRKWIALIVFVMIALNISVAFAAEPNPHVTIVNPAHENTLFSDNLLVSVKLTQPVTIEVSVLQIWKVVNGTNETITLEEYQKAQSPDTRIEVDASVFASMDPFTSTNHLSFYTRRIENVTPGLYMIHVNTLSADGKVTNTDTSVVVMRAKEENQTDPASSATPQSGPSQFLKGLLRSIFGN